MVEGFCFGAFVSARTNERLQQQLDALPVTFQGRSCLLAGPSRSGRSSLLFQYAYQVAAAHPDRRVFYICRPQQLEDAPPLLFEGVSRSSAEFSRVHIRYLTEEAQLRKYFAALHMLPIEQLPYAVIVDDFSDFFHRRYASWSERDASMAKTLALAYDATEHMSARLPQPAQCKLVIGERSGEDGMPSSLYVYERWLPLVLLLRHTHGGGGDVELRAHDTPRMADKTRTCVAFRMANRSLVLQQVASHAPAPAQPYQ